MGSRVGAQRLLPGDALQRHLPQGVVAHGGCRAGLYPGCHSRGPITVPRVVGEGAGGDGRAPGLGCTPGLAAW